MKNAIHRLIFPLILCMVLGACAEKQDFDQYKDLSATPTFEGSMLYIEVPESSINQVVGTNFFTNDFNFDAFNANVVVNRVLDGVVIYEVINTTSKTLNIVVELVDGDGNVLDTESFSVDPAPTAVLQREIAYGPAGQSIDIIKNTSSIRVSATNLGDNTSTSTLPDPVIILKSAGKFRFRVK